MKIKLSTLKKMIREAVDASSFPRHTMKHVNFDDPRWDDEGDERRLASRSSRADAGEYEDILDDEERELSYMHDWASRESKRPKKENEF